MTSALSSTEMAFGQRPPAMHQREQNSRNSSPCSRLFLERQSAIAAAVTGEMVTSPRGNRREMVATELREFKPVSVSEAKKFAAVLFRLLERRSANLFRPPHPQLTTIYHFVIEELRAWRTSGELQNIVQMPVQEISLTEIARKIESECAGLERGNRGPPKAIRVEERVARMDHFYFERGAEIYPSESGVVEAAKKLEFSWVTCWKIAEWLQTWRKKGDWGELVGRSRLMRKIRESNQTKMAVAQLRSNPVTVRDEEDSDTQRREQALWEIRDLNVVLSGIEELDGWEVEKLEEFVEDLESGDFCLLPLVRNYAPYGASCRWLWELWKENYSVAELLLGLSGEFSVFFAETRYREDPERPERVTEANIFPCIQKVWLTEEEISGENGFTEKLSLLREMISQLPRKAESFNVLSSGKRQLIWNYAEAIFRNVSAQNHEGDMEVDFPFAELFSLPWREFCTTLNGGKNLPAELNEAQAITLSYLRLLDLRERWVEISFYRSEEGLQALRSAIRSLLMGTAKEGPLRIEQLEYLLQKSKWLFSDFTRKTLQEMREETVDVSLPYLEGYLLGNPLPDAISAEDRRWLVIHWSLDLLLILQSSSLQELVKPHWKTLCERRWITPLAVHSLASLEMNDSERLEAFFAVISTWCRARGVTSRRIEFSFLLSVSRELLEEFSELAQEGRIVWKQTLRETILHLKRSHLEYHVENLSEESALTLTSEEKEWLTEESGWTLPELLQFGLEELKQLCASHWRTLTLVGINHQEAREDLFQLKPEKRIQVCLILRRLCDVLQSWEGVDVSVLCEQPDQVLALLGTVSIDEESSVNAVIAQAQAAALERHAGPPGRNPFLKRVIGRESLALTDMERLLRLTPSHCAAILALAERWENLGYRLEEGNWADLIRREKWVLQEVLEFFQRSVDFSSSEGTTLESVLLGQEIAILYHRRACSRGISREDAVWLLQESPWSLGNLLQFRPQELRRLIGKKWKALISLGRVNKSEASRMANASAGQRQAIFRFVEKWVVLPISYLLPFFSSDPYPHPLDIRIDQLCRQNPVTLNTLSRDEQQRQEVDHFLQRYNKNLIDLFALDSRIVWEMVVVDWPRCYRSRDSWEALVACYTMQAEIVSNR